MSIKSITIEDTICIYKELHEVQKLRNCMQKNERTFKALSHFRDEILKSFKIIQNRIKLEDLRKMLHS